MFVRRGPVVDERRGRCRRPLPLNLRSAWADIHALGSSAVVRAGYEASKATGLHGLVFDGIVRTSRQPAPFRAVLAPRGPIPAGAAARTVDEADRIVSGELVIFGRPLAIGPDPDWHSILDRPGDWPLIPWWKIDIRSGRRAGDVKWAWEVGRHRHLVVLARAAFLHPDDPRYIATLEQHLDSWVGQNPPERGVHWYSNLEIALRSINWLQVLSLVGDRLSVA